MHKTLCVNKLSTKDLFMVKVVFVGLLRSTKDFAHKIRVFGHNFQNRTHALFSIYFLKFCEPHTHKMMERVSWDL